MGRATRAAGLDNTVYQELAGLGEKHVETEPCLESDDDNRDLQVFGDKDSVEHVGVKRRFREFLDLCRLEKRMVPGSTVDSFARAKVLLDRADEAGLCVMTEPEKRPSL